ncbi:MAG TPA: 50S ribosomal protein L9, partial [Spirochaetales bacterium]|nr:50S ribosomal protein L9 [Spirochaetales bacterium]
KDVANGYARNYLLPRGLVVPYTPVTVAMFEKRKAEIEARKAEKRRLSADLKTRLESEELVFDVVVGTGGKLYGAITSTSLAEELHKKGYEIERKKIEIPGRIIKNVGTYKATIHLYEGEQALIKFTVKGHEEKKEQPSTPVKEKRRREPNNKKDAEKGSEEQA